MGARERIFVTGATGRVGLPLVRQLVSQGHSVVGLARDARKGAQVGAAGAEVVVGDLDDADALARGLQGATVVHHLAGGLRGPGRITADRVNHQGARRLVEALERARPPLRALVFTSTAAVYGDRSGLWVDEEMPPHPDTDYGRSKVAAEDVLLDAWRDRGLPVRVVRLAAVYGPGFPFMLADPIRAGRAWLPGEGRNFVPTVHVDDAVGGLCLVADRGRDGQVVNLADPDPVPLETFYGMVHERVGGRPVRFWSTWVPSYVQYGLARRNERLQSRLGRQPRFTPDNLRMFTASFRLKVERLDKELGFAWRYPTARDGLAAALGA